MKRVPTIGFAAIAALALLPSVAFATPMGDAISGIAEGVMPSAAGVVADFGPLVGIVLGISLAMFVVGSLIAIVMSRKSNSGGE